MEFAASYMYKQLENRRYKYIGETIYLWDYDAMCKICRSLSFCYFLLYYWRLISTPEIPNLYPLCFTIVSWYCPSNSNARGKEKRKDNLQSKNNDPWQVGMPLKSISFVPWRVLYCFTRVLLLYHSPEWQTDSLDALVTTEFGFNCEKL